VKPLVVTSDLHLHPFRLCSNDGGRDRLADGLSALEQSLQVALDLNALWIFAGDMKSPRTYWPQEALNGALALFHRFSSVPKLLLPGNHDGPRVPGGSGLQAFTTCTNTRVVELPTLLPGWAPGLAVWPCEADESGLETFVEQAQKTGCKVLLSHGLLSGCKLGPDSSRGIGLTPERFGIGVANPAFSLAIFGDVHRGQMFRQYRHQWAWQAWDETLQAPQSFPAKEQVIHRGFHGQIIYPGDPYQQNWGEAGEWPKGALIVRPDSQEISLQPIKGPRFIKQDWTGRDLEEFKAFILGKFSLAGEDLSTWEGNFVRVTLPPWGDDRACQEVLNTVPKVAHTRAFQLIVERVPRVEVRSRIHAGMEPFQLVSEYVAARPPEEGLDEKAVITAGMHLMKE
jgi:hypothetical protein